MGSAVLEPPKRSSRRPPAKPPRHWWGSGPPPHERWPGVTLDFKAQWSNLRSRWETHHGAYYWDGKKADRATDFFPMFLQHHIGDFAGQRFVLRADQAHLIVRPTFGWRRASDGMRRFRKVFAFCPKGYGKSPLGAGIGLYLARYDGEPAAEVYAVAADREQARTVHDNAKIMVENSPELLEGAVIMKNAITWPDLYSKYLVLSSDASTKHGFRPHGVIFDELHAQRNRDLFEALRKSMAKRAQPLMVIITHAGIDDESICYEEYELAKRVLDGYADIEATLPVIFELGRDEKWNDPEVWQRVNPGHGVTIRHDDILEECREAEIEPRKRNDFKRFHCNSWTSQAVAWIPIEWFDACEGTLDDADLAQLEVCAGLDLAQKWDLAAFVLTFRRWIKSTDAASVEVAQVDAQGNANTRRVDLNYELFCKAFFWIPEDTMREHEKEDGVPYSEWAEANLITPTEGPIIDYTRIYRDITEQILPRFPKLKQGLIGYDPAFATDLSTVLRDRAGLKVVEVLQNYPMLSEPAQVVEALIKGKRFHHDGHRVYRWNWLNAAVKTDDAGRIRPIKPKNRSKRVDGAVATVIGARALASVPPTPQFQVIVIGGGKGGGTKR